MDFLDPKKRRRHRIRLFIMYGVIAVLLALGTRVLFFTASGCNIADTASTDCSQENGVLFIDAHPEPANISINNESRGATDARYILPEDNYDISLSRAGYTTWQKRISVVGSEVRRVVYPFLVPQELEPTDEVLYGAVPSFVTQSPDRRWLLSQSADKSLTFELIDLNEDSIRTQNIELDKQLFSFEGPAYNFEVVEWSNNNRHLILRHTFDEGVEFIRLDIERPNESIQLADVIPTSFTSVELKDKKHDSFYVLNNNRQLLRIDQEGSLPVVVAEDVIDFKSHGNNQLLYVVASEDDSEVSVVGVDGNDILPFRNIPVSKSGYVLDLATYEGEWLVVIGSKDDSQIFVYQMDFFNQLRLRKNDPLLLDLIPTQILRNESQVRYGRFSANVRFFALQSENRFRVYDAELERQYVFDVDFDVARNTPAYWMDGHRLNLLDESGNMHMFEFDGGNVRQLASAVKNPGKIFFDRDYNRFFLVSDSITAKGRFALQQTHMRIESDR